MAEVVGHGRGGGAWQRQALPLRVTGHHGCGLKSGINLSRRMGMHLMDLPDVIQPNYMPFELKIQEHKNWITKDYILALESYKRRQGNYKAMHLHYWKLCQNKSGLDNGLPYKKLW